MELKISLPVDRKNADTIQWLMEQFHSQAVLGPKELARFGHGEHYAKVGHCSIDRAPGGKVEFVLLTVTPEV